MNIKTIIIFIAVIIGVLGGVGGLLWQFGQSDQKAIADIAGSSVHRQGEGAVTIVEFSDFQCPACLSVQVPLKQILKKFEGKVSFVYRHFPLSSIHKNAQLAAQAAEAAGLQGKFFEMHDLLFAKQIEWSGLPTPTEKFVSYASEIGLDKDKFGKDLESSAVKELVSADSLSAARYRLTGTPSFFVNGMKVEFPQLEIKLVELTK